MVQMKGSCFHGSSFIKTFKIICHVFDFYFQKREPSHLGEIWKVAIVTKTLLLFSKKVSRVSCFYLYPLKVEEGVSIILTGLVYTSDKL